MAEPTTIRLTATALLNGSGLILSPAKPCKTTTAGRLYSATILTGSRLTSDIFGIFSSGAYTSITVSASTDNPGDVLRVYLGAAIRSEHRLAGSQTITSPPEKSSASSPRPPLSSCSSSTSSPKLTKPPASTAPLRPSSAPASPATPASPPPAS
ncbi:MAG: hypothetical protein IPK80_20905 [Nannocystis sp.]|nr:hypothetical protein [Nannocystis sp.]